MNLRTFGIPCLYNWFRDAEESELRLQVSTPNLPPCYGEFSPSGKPPGVKDQSVGL